MTEFIPKTLLIPNYPASSAEPNFPTRLNQDSKAYISLFQICTGLVFINVVNTKVNGLRALAGAMVLVSRADLRHGEHPSGRKFIDLLLSVVVEATHKDLFTSVMERANKLTSLCMIMR